MKNAYKKAYVKESLAIWKRRLAEAQARESEED